MSGSWFRTDGVAPRRDGRNALLALLLVPMFSIAESIHGTNSASSRLRFTVVVPPVFRVLETTVTMEGYEYRVWTNKKSVVINGREYRFDRVGETTLKVPKTPDGVFVVHGL